MEVKNSDKLRTKKEGQNGTNELTILVIPNLKLSAVNPQDAVKGQRALTAVFFSPI